jgi:hypothetical protein
MVKWSHICNSYILLSGGETYPTRNHADTSRGLPSGHLGFDAFLLENRTKRSNSISRYLHSLKEGPGRSRTISCSYINATITPTLITTSTNASALHIIIIFVIIIVVVVLIYAPVRPITKTSGSIPITELKHKNSRTLRQRKLLAATNTSCIKVWIFATLTRLMSHHQHPSVVVSQIIPWASLFLI